MSVWRRGKTKVNRLLGNAPPGTSVKHESNDSTTSLTLLPPTPPTRSPTPPTRSSTPPIHLPTPPIHLPTPPIHLPTPPAMLPYDIAEIIIAHLTDDIPTLKACSLTCRSLSIAATPHLYHILTLTGGRPEIDRSRLEPLSKLHELGLMPFVREIRVKQGKGSSSWLVPQAFNHLDLRHFSAFANVHTLKIQNMEVYRFIPDIERYFEHFSPTLRSITLRDPCCTPLQLSYFLSFFPNLDDIDIRLAGFAKNVPNTTVPDTELVPFSTPKLQGWLVLYRFGWVETWTRLIASSDSLRFRNMDICRSASCERVLFEACAKTLETLQVHMNDRPAGAPDLSRLEVLRSLQLRGWITDNIRSNRRSTFAMGVFSTITSPEFSELVIFIGSSVAYLAQNIKFFETLRRMHEVRPFKLVFLFKASDRWNTPQGVAKAVGLVIEKGLVDFLDSPPAIRTARSCYSEWGIVDLD